MEWRRLIKLRELCEDTEISTSRKIEVLRVFLQRGSQELDKVDSWTSKLLNMSLANRLRISNLKRKAREILAVKVEEMGAAELTRVGLQLEALRILNRTLNERNRQIVAYQNKVTTLKRSVIAKLALIRRLVNDITN